MKKNKGNFLKETIMFSVKGNANSTTCGYIYQPKAPASLKKFSKLNDK